MQVKGIDHMGLVVADLEKARWFYRDFLGMDEVERPENFHFEGAWFAAGACHIHMIMGHDTTARAGLADQGTGKADGLATHWAFEVEGIDAYVEKAREMGVTIVGGPMERGLGATQIYLEDADGYVVELFEMTYRGDGKVKVRYK